jgi:hypothetical protein
MAGEAVQAVFHRSGGEASAHDRLGQDVHNPSHLHQS